MDGVAQQVQRLGRAKQLDPYADRVERLFRPVFQATAVKNALSGVWLRHRLHPMLTDIAIGALGGASVIDFLAPRNRKAARRLLGLGIMAALPTAAAGLNDWVDVYEDGRRIGLVHATGNTAALLCYWHSFRRHRRGKGRLWSLMGLSALIASGYLGGHLSYVLGVGVDHTAFQPRLEEWEDVAASMDVPEGVLMRAVAKEFPIVLVRRGGRAYALADRCSHAGWGLADGELDGNCVTCPAHGSIFSIFDGAVRRGPLPALKLRTKSVKSTVESTCGRPETTRTPSHPWPFPQSSASPHQQSSLLTARTLVRGLVSRKMPGLTFEPGTRSLGVRLPRMNPAPNGHEGIGFFEARVSRASSVSGKGPRL